MLQLPQKSAGKTTAVPSAQPPQMVQTVANDPIFGNMPAGFDLQVQPIPMLVYWLKKARAKVDAITEDAITSGGYSEADLAAALETFNQIFNAIVNAESDSASDVAWQMHTVVGYLDCLKTDCIEEVITADQFRTIAANLKAATAFRQPKKYPGKDAHGQRLTRAGLLRRYQSFLIDEIHTLSNELYGDPQYALQYLSFDDVVRKVLKGKRNRGSVGLISRARSVLKSLTIDTEKVEF